ncbi:Peptidoglycan/LPS O-acetylase OafA/YrhL, contains acyltransferase and SGNH-hydrolase domains [Roseateles sp. YR242]|uniref:acyltransferase family protein n=1 Tax=Roseateles sp. YR242 TaxID=1855305 RepID=UPI0008CE101E|nr:acyltransferase [Roseateles sp. YR242]SEK54426.1 Peptidoglycan/LPS O-acetylase OafA/YrhL, contains acyltransferase and SGNH-hydrolase domains [Roseateles sp. YR242]
MNPTDGWPALVALALALLTSHLVAGRGHLHEEASRFRSIDGLRGYLAFGVFLHHAAIWQGYRTTGQWAPLNSAFYMNAGKGSVALFFMITAFLFYSRLLDARHKPMDWTRLFAGRLFRLTPAYLVMLALLLAVVTVETGGRLQVAFPALLRQLADWLLFTFPGKSDINGLLETQVIVSGVTWSLPFEWMFYAALPVLVLLTGRRPSLGALAVTASFCLMFLCWKPSLNNFLPFGVGMVAAYSSRWQWLRNWAHGPVASALVLLCLLGGYGLAMKTYSPLPQLLQAGAFVLIAAGNDLFGVLSCRVSRTFGEPTYSLYLLHGLVLYIGFKWLIGPAAVQMTSTQHWLAVWAMTPVIVLFSHLCHRYVEMPGMALTGLTLRRLRVGRAAAPAAMSGA